MEISLCKYASWVNHQKIASFAITSIHRTGQTVDSLDRNDLEVSLLSIMELLHSRMQLSFNNHDLLETDKCTYTS